MKRILLPVLLLAGVWSQSALAQDRPQPCFVTGTCGANIPAIPFDLLPPGKEADLFGSDYFPGNDVLAGGAGDDVYLFGRSSRSDRVLETAAGARWDEVWLRTEAAKLRLKPALSPNNVDKTMAAPAVAIAPSQGCISVMTSAASVERAASRILRRWQIKSATAAPAMMCTGFAISANKKSTPTRHPTMLPLMRMTASSRASLPSGDRTSTTEISAQI